MPAAVIRGILLTAGIIAALGLAAYENPEIQRWVDEQRRKIAQFLRSIGDELDPQTRREAEAFAFGATTTSNNESTRAESSATATGAEPAAASTVRRVPMQGSVSAEEREQRQRLGEEYLARRQRQMQEMQERRQTMSRSTSFDSIVDEEGKLKTEEVKEEPVAEASSSNSWQEPFLQASANPFADAYEIDRSSTPRPAVPPKIKLEEMDPIPVPESVRSVDETEMPGPMPGAMPEEEASELSYEDQLAIALSLSKEEGDRAAQMSHSAVFEHDLHQAIRRSLQEQHSPDAPDPDISVPPSLAGSIDELYDVTPNLTRASLAQLNVQHPSLEPERPAVLQDTSGMQTPSQRSTSPVARSHTMSEAEMIDVEDQASDIISEDGIVTPDSWTEVGDSDTEMPQTAL